MGTEKTATETARHGSTGRQAVPETSRDGRKLTSNRANIGHPANDIINPHWQSAQNDTDPPHAGDHAPAAPTDAVGAVKGRKGSGTPTLSGAGQLADDRPGRNEPKSEHASSSLNTHE